MQRAQVPSLVRKLGYYMPHGPKKKGFFNCVSSAIFKIDNQQGPTAIAQGTLLNVLRQPGWEGSLREKGYMYMYA